MSTRITSGLPNIVEQRDELAAEVKKLRPALTEAQHNEASAMAVVMAQEGIIERLQRALHDISLCSQNSMSDKAECGRIARAALPRTSSIMVEQEKVIDGLQAKIAELKADAARYQWVKKYPPQAEFLLRYIFSEDIDKRIDLAIESGKAAI